MARRTILSVVGGLAVLGCGSALGQVVDGPGPAVEFSTRINLHGNSISVKGKFVSVSGTVATITAPGTYIVTGSLTDGRIIVDSHGAGRVRIILNGVTISSSVSAPIYVKQSALTEIVLADGSVNVISDPSTYVYDDPVAMEPNAALFSDDALVVSGTGSLSVAAHFNDGIASKDSLIINGGVLNVSAIDDGIRGKDSLIVNNGLMTLNVGGDGLKADNEVDAILGAITITNGDFHITCGGDAISAAKTVDIGGGTFTILAGGGHTVTIPTTASAKGIKGVTGVTIGGGTLNIDAADDGLHSNANVGVNAGAITIATNNSTSAGYGDAVHADATTSITGGTVNITACYEGIEGANIAISNADVHVVSSNDAITADGSVNIASGTFTLVSGGGHTVTIPSTSSAKGIKGLASVTIGGGTFTMDCADDGVHSNNAVVINGGTMTIATNSSTSASYGDGLHSDVSLDINGGTITVNPSYEGAEASHITITNGTLRVTSTDDGINASGGTSNWIHINGGYVVVNASGDGIDSNGAITMSGGTVLVNGPTADNNAPLDYDTTFQISGGLLVAAGSAGMAQAPSSSSTQRSIKITYSAAKAAGTMAHIQKTSGGADILTFVPSKQYRSLVVSSPAFTSGLSCQLYRGGTSSGMLLDGLYTGGVYTPGTLTNTFTTTNIVTNVSAP
ncbi:MAG: carbohydrate-binding domain-containing protein [Phycisphaerales bacterium]|nr:carbohydrate-binding domain-containing protein [Phycisphaerales bacterium]